MSRIERTLAGGKSTRAHFKNVIHFTFVTGSDRITAESFDAPRAEAAESTSSLTGRACAPSKHKATTQLMKYVSNTLQLRTTSVIHLQNENYSKYLFSLQKLHIFFLLDDK